MNELIRLAVIDTVDGKLEERFVNLAHVMWLRPAEMRPTWGTDSPIVEVLEVQLYEFAQPLLCWNEVQHRSGEYIVRAKDGQP